MPRSQKSNLPKVRSNDWVTLASACVKVRDMLRQHHKELAGLVDWQRDNSKHYIYVPVYQLERFYRDGLGAMEILRKALKGR